MTNNMTHSPPSSSSQQRMHNDSRAIRKPSYSVDASSPKQENPCTKRPDPVIIYLNAPTVYHTQPCNFKATVQRLTGLTQSEVSSKSKVSDVVTSNEDNQRKDRHNIDGGGGNVGFVDDDDTISMLIDHRMNDIFPTWNHDESLSDPALGEFLDKHFDFSDMGSRLS